MTPPRDAILALYNRIADLSHAAAILEWDQETYMPDGATPSRAHQIATLRRLAHEFATSDELRQALESLESYVREEPDDDFAAALARIGRRDFDRATRLPANFVAKLAETESRAKTAWRLAREANDFSRLRDDLEGIVDLNKEKAALLGFDDHPYDALLDQFEPGMTTAAVSGLFSDLRAELVPIVAAIAEKRDDRASLLRREFDPAKQWEIGERLIRQIGFDFNAGRQDLSAHPFCTSFSIDDVRITTRVDPDFFPSAFFGTLHETGHGLYEQGVDRRFERTPLADGTSLGMHESQSRMWENQVGRSRPFVDFVWPILTGAFAQLSGSGAEDIYRAINAVEPSLIRVEADELTYNLHVMLRFELEVALFENRLEVRDLPHAWNEAMDAYLGVRPSGDAAGVLQDIHWSMGGFGYFPTYTIGNLMSAQLFERAAEEIADLDERIRRGRFDALLLWLRHNVHRHGRSKSAESILRDVTDRGLTAEPWLAYVRTKYSDLYDLDLR